MNYRTSIYQTALLLVLLLAGASSAFAQDAESALKQFEGKVLVLQHPLRNKSLLYNSNGELLTTIKDKDAGSWTAYGGIFIENVSVAPDKLVLQGHRMLFTFKNPGIALQELKHKKHSSPLAPDLHIEIKLEHALDSASQAKEIMKNIFALDTANLIEAAKSFWNPYLKDHIVYDSSLPQAQEFLWQNPVKKQNAAEQNSLVPTTKGKNGEYVTHVGGKITAPKALDTPEPKYTDLALSEDFEGVLVLTIVVGNDGHVHDVRVASPLGMGLDESASEAVMKWRFDPARKDKEPVAVEMNVEVSFTP